MQVTTIGLDIAKRVFQVHGIDAAGAVVVRRKLRRSEKGFLYFNLHDYETTRAFCSIAPWHIRRERGLVWPEQLSGVRSKQHIYPWRSQSKS